MRTRTERQTQRQSEAAGNPLNEMRTTRKNKRKKKNRSKSGETKAKKPARTWNVSERNHAAFVRLFNRNSSMRTHREISRQRATGRRRQTSTQQEAGRTTVIYLSIYLSLSLDVEIFLQHFLQRTVSELVRFGDQMEVSDVRLVGRRRRGAPQQRPDPAVHPVASSDTIQREPHLPRRHDKSVVPGFLRRCKYTTLLAFAANRRAAYGPTAANPPHAAAVGRRTDGQTDRQTPYRYIAAASSATYYARRPNRIMHNWSSIVNLNINSLQKYKRNRYKTHR